MTNKKGLKNALLAIPRNFALTRRESGNHQLALNLPGQRRLVSHFSRGFLLLIEFTAGVALALALAIVVLAWRLTTGDIAVDFLAAPIENAVNAQLDGYSVHIGGAVLQQSDAGAGISFRLREIALTDKLGFPLAEAPKAAIGIDPVLLLVGQVSPTFIDLIGPKLVMVYRRDGRLAMETNRDLAARSESEILSSDNSVEQFADRDSASSGDSGQGEAQSTINGIRALLGFQEGVTSPLDTLSRIGIRDADLVFIHERLAIRWELKHGDLDITRQEGAVAYEIKVHLADNQGADPMRISGLVSGLGDGLMVTSNVEQFSPRRSVNQIEGLGGLAALDIPISTQFSMKIASDGSVVYADMNADFAAGHIRLSEDEGDEGILVDEGNLALRYDAEKQRIEVGPSTFYSGQNFVAFQGSIVATTEGGRDYWRYELVSNDATLSSADIQEPAIAIAQAKFSGRYEPHSGDFFLDTGKIESEAASFTLSGRVRAAESSPEFDMVVNLSPISTSALKQIWPSFLAAGAREWVNENIISGLVTDGSIEAHFPPGLITSLDRGGAIPDDALKIRFGFDDVVVRYFRPLPLLRSLKGRGVMQGGHFSLDASNGHVVVGSGERVEKISGHMEIPEVTAETPIAYIRMEGSGGSGAVLELLDYEPLGYAGEIGIQPADVEGTTVVDLDLSIPLLRDIKFEDVNIAAEATASNLYARSFFGGRDITDGTLQIEVLPTRIEVGGEVLVADVPVKVEWQRPFGRRSANAGQLTMRATLDQEERERIGLGFEAVRGPVTLEARPLDVAGGDIAFDVKMDLTAAQIRFDAFGWVKPPGQTSGSSFQLIQQKSGSLKLQEFKFVGAGAVMAGEVELSATGNLVSANLSTFQLSRDDDLSLALSRAENGVIDVEVVGRSIDASSLIRQYFSFAPSADSAASSNSENSRINLDASIARVKGLSNDVLTDMKVTLEAVDGLIERLSLNGQISGSSVVTTLTPLNRGQGRKLDIDSRNAGAAFRYVGLYSRINGGNLTVAANLSRDPAGTMKGNLLVERFTVASGAVIREIAEASQATNMTDIEARGIFFDRMNLVFERNGSVLYLKDSYLRGPSLGATLSGNVDFGRDHLEVSGTYVPLYAVNNLLSHVPLFGQILTGGRNEGVVGITFSVVGPVGGPTVLVNPISAMAPGVFRKLFNFPTPSAPTAEQPSPNVEGSR